MVEYDIKSVIPSYPSIERDTENFKHQAGVPPGAIAKVTKLPTTTFEGNEVACGEYVSRIECYDDDTIDIIVTQVGFEEIHYEMADGSVLPVARPAPGVEQANSRHMYHVRPGGEFTVQSLAGEKGYPRTFESATEVLGIYVPWSIAEQVAAYPGAKVERDELGRVLRAEATSPKGRLVEVVCTGWEEMPIRHPEALTITERSKTGNTREHTTFRRRAKAAD